MNFLKHANLHHPRKQALLAMRSTLTVAEWERNAKFVETLRSQIADHRMCKHPVIDVLNNQKVPLQVLQTLHLEYRHAIVQTFTDALLAAQLETRQLEPRLEASAKMAPRLLLTLNCLDEFGFRPGMDVDGYYCGNPERAHYPLFEAVLDDLKISASVRRDYTPTPSAARAREFLEESFAIYVDVVSLLAVAEHQVILFTPPLRRATGSLGIDVNDGYYFVHGVTSDNTAEAADDDHAEDLWQLLTQAVMTTDYESIFGKCRQYTDLWASFWDQQLIFIEQAGQIATEPERHAIHACR
jgi:hypothetical protein